VVNFELPNIAEDYVHRIGRTGRAGNDGEAMSLVCVDELPLLRDIERLIKRDIPKILVDDFEPDPSVKPEPIQKGRGKSPQGAARRSAANSPISSRNNSRQGFRGRSSGPAGSRNQSRNSSRGRMHRGPQGAR